MIHKKLLQDIKTRLQVAFSTRFKGVVLYGSEAKNEAHADSDIDLLVLLNSPIILWEDTHAIIDALYDLQLQILRPIHVTPVDVEAYEDGEYALFRNAKREGISA